MVEKYVYIERPLAQALINEAKHMKATKRGIDRRAFLLGEHAVLSTERLKLRNVVTRDDDLNYLDEIIQTLNELYQQGVAVVPILGYCYDDTSCDGSGWLIQARAKGEELYDDAILARFQVWTQDKPDGVYLTSPLNHEEASAYLLDRTRMIAQVPQEHFDRFVCDMREILSQNILIDCNGQSNFFYDVDKGFQFIDLDTHNDYRYGLTQKKPEIEEVLCQCAFTPCHYAEGTEFYAHIALSEQTIRQLGDEKLQSLKQSNQMVFEKCRKALEHNGVSVEQIERTLPKIKIFGVEVR